MTDPLYDTIFPAGVQSLKDQWTEQMKAYLDAWAADGVTPELRCGAESGRIQYDVTEMSFHDGEIEAYDVQDDLGSAVSYGYWLGPDGKVEAILQDYGSMVSASIVGYLLTEERAKALAAQHAHLLDRPYRAGHLTPRRHHD